jgi:hypothetical protein
MNKLLFISQIIIGFLILLLLPSHSESQILPSSGPSDTSGVLQLTLFPEEDPFLVSEPLHVSLEFDMKKLIRQKLKDQYQEALFRYQDKNGDTLIHELQIKARGEFRKTHCRFPPIKLNFRRSEAGHDFFNDVNKLKLVTHCQQSGAYQQYLFKEYLVYKIYNLLTNNSYRVRLFIIEYKDSMGKMKSIHNYGFIIESNALISSRVNLDILERQNIPGWQIDKFNANLMAMFQFLIGNPDWSIPKLHNIRLLTSSDPKDIPIAIPYDFDCSGMVNPHYAIPDESMGIQSVRTRIYRGYCLTADEEYQLYFNEFIKNKDEIYSLILNFSLLSEKHRTEMIDYLDSFYEIIEDPRQAKRQIFNVCREIPSG